MAPDKVRLKEQLLARIRDSEHGAADACMRSTPHFPTRDVVKAGDGRMLKSCFFFFFFGGGGRVISVHPQLLGSSARSRNGPA